MLNYAPKFRKEYELEKVPLFNNKNLAQLIELFFNWLTNKKYLGHKVKINENYHFWSISAMILNTRQKML